MTGVHALALFVLYFQTGMRLFCAIAERDVLDRTVCLGSALLLKFVLAVLGWGWCP